MTLLSKNLNTLPVLRALLEEVSIVGAARRVGLSQPTVSGILVRLRTEFDDPILVRSGRGMRLTVRAERLLPAVVELCEALEGLYRREHFTPSALARQFVIAAPDHLAFLLTPFLYRRIGEEAPAVRLRFVDVPVDLDTYLGTGSIDLAVCANLGFWSGLRFAPLFTERIVAAMSHDHPLAERSSVTTEEIRRYPSCGMDSSIAGSVHQSRIPTGFPLIDSPSPVTLSHFTDAVLLTVGSDFVAATPECLVRHLSRVLPVRSVAVDGHVATPAGTFWAPVHDHDAEHLWIRGLIEQAVAATL